VVCAWWVLLNLVCVGGLKFKTRVIPGSIRNLCSLSIYTGYWVFDGLTRDSGSTAGVTAMVAIFQNIPPDSESPESWG
jgi:hypothetical protein